MPRIVSKLSSDFQRILRASCAVAFSAWIEKMYGHNRKSCGNAELSGRARRHGGDISESVASHFLFFRFLFSTEWRGYGSSSASLNSLPSAEPSVRIPGGRNKFSKFRKSTNANRAKLRSWNSLRHIHQQARRR